LVLLKRVLETFAPSQRDAFAAIWQRLSGEIASRSGGRVPAALGAQQAADIRQLVHPIAVALLFALGDGWGASQTEVVLNLLLANDNASAAVEAMLATTSPAQRSSTEKSTLPNDAVQDDAPIPAPDAPARDTASNQQTPLLAGVWSALDPVQRLAFRRVWQRLSGEIARHADARALATLTSQQKADLAARLLPFAGTQVNELAHQWPEAGALRDATAIAQAAVRLLLAGDAGTAAFNAMLAGPAGDAPAPRSTKSAKSRAADGSGIKPALQEHAVSTPLPADQQPQVEVDRFTAHHETSHNQQAGLMLLTRIWRSLDAAQRAAFRTLWQRLSEEVATRAAGRALTTLSALQRTDLAALLQPVTTELLQEFTQQWPQAISAEDQIALVQSAAQLALADDDVALVVVSMLKEEAAAAITTSNAEPALAAFHDWQQGKLNIQTQSLSLADLRQWLNWWLLHVPQLVNQDCSLMLSAIDAQAQRIEDPVRFMKRVLASLQAGEALDLEALSQQSDAPIEMTLAEALQSRAAIQQFIAGQGVQPGGLDSAQMHQLVRAWLRHLGGDTALFMTAIEAHAARAASPQAFLLEVLKQLTADQPVDLEQILADGWASMPAPADSVQPAEDEPVPQVPSALPAQLRQALPKRLATAMLQADFASLDIIWPDLVQSHATELAEAARHYLARSDVRERLVAHTDAAMLKDLLGALSRPAMRLVDPILQHGLQCGAMLPSPLSADAFEQHVLRFAFEQALKPEADALAWLGGLTSSLPATSDEQRLQLHHAWYEVLRTGKQSSPLLGALEQELFLSPAPVIGGAETAISMLLMRDAELDAGERAGLASLMQRAFAENGAAQQGALDIALADRRAVERLTDALPGASMARLFATLRPAAAGRLPVLLRQLHKALPISFAAVPAMLDRRIWKAIYLAAFADGAADAAPEAWMRAVVIHLAGQYQQADVEAWLGNVAKATVSGAAEQTAPTASTAQAEPTVPVGPAAQTAPAGSTAPGVAALAGQAVAAVRTAAATSEQALVRLLQPWAEAKPVPSTKKPAPAKRASEEELPFTGEANIHNAGLVIVIPYVQRLFGILELTVDGKFVNDGATERAVHLLQYVVTGEESTPEYQLVLNKLLCGIHGGTPIVPGISITDKEKTIIEQMLNGVITHWSALGKTSIAGLRETFLQRQGHLYHEDEAWHLKIPQKSFDMLLDRLPWSFAMTRMPWMAEPLNVTWRG
jgi:hypothetical protein